MFDLNINEYSVYRLNHSSSLFPIRKLTQELTVRLKEVNREFIINRGSVAKTGVSKSYSLQILDLLKNFFSEFRTFPAIIRELSISAIKEITKILLEEIKSNVEGKANLPEVFDESYIFCSDDLSVSPFLRELSKINHDLITAIDTLKRWKHEVSEVEYMYIDNYIEKEICRRNIPTKFSYNEDLMLSFDSKDKSN